MNGETQQALGRCETFEISGLVTSEVLLALHEMAAPRALWDLRGADLSPLSFHELRSLGARVQAHSPPTASQRTALVCDTDLAFGICRTLGSLFEQRGLPVQHAVFRDRSTARRWLTRQA